jgi:tetratricopeptide (TPR) repeat protein
MAQAGWPGFSSEGALWFTDLTQQALVFAEVGLQLPLGLPGLLLPFAATGIMLTSIHLGFKASGAAAAHPSLAGTWVSTALLWLRPALYALTIASAGIKVQLPQAPVLHWVTTSSYTLALQLGLRSPRVRQALGFSQAGSVDSSRDIDPAVVAQAAAMDNADVLVVMGAKHAALQRYNEAMYCLERALQLNPNNAR